MALGQNTLGALRLSLSRAGGRPLPDGVANPALADVVSHPRSGRTEAFILVEGPDELDDLADRSAQAREAAVDLWLVWCGVGLPGADSLMAVLQLAAEHHVGIAALEGPELLRIRPPESPPLVEVPSDS